MSLLVPAHPGSSGQRAVKRLYVCNKCICVTVIVKIDKTENSGKQIYILHHMILYYYCMLNKFYGTAHSMDIENVRIQM